jgi:VanZ family protein
MASTDKNTHSFTRYQLPILLWCGVIFVLSSIPGSSYPSIHLIVHQDKIIHAGFYAVFCWLSHRALLHQPNTVLARTSLFMALVATIAYGCSDEYHQLYVAGRSADIMDMLADTTGGLMYVLWFQFIAGKKSGLSASGASS